MINLNERRRCINVQEDFLVFDEPEYHPSADGQMKKSEVKTTSYHFELKERIFEKRVRYYETKREKVDMEVYAKKEITQELMKEIFEFGIECLTEQQVVSTKLPFNYSIRNYTYQKKYRPQMPDDLNPNKPVEIIYTVLVEYYERVQ